MPARRLTGYLRQVPTDASLALPLCPSRLQSISLEEMEAHLKEWGLDYVKQVFVEDGVEVRRRPRGGML